MGHLSKIFKVNCLLRRELQYEGPEPSKACMNKRKKEKNPAGTKSSSTEPWPVWLIWLEKRTIDWKGWVQFPLSCTRQEPTEAFLSLPSSLPKKAIKLSFDEDLNNNNNKKRTLEH